MIGIVDYGVGNIKAFANIYNSLNIQYKLISTPSDFDVVTKIILPGVGAFDYAMEMLNHSGMIDKLTEIVLQKKVPLLGVCVGMQMLASSSDEGFLPGLGWINSRVKKFYFSDLNNKFPLPHMGWNSLIIVKDSEVFRNLEEKPMFYFLHSYYFECLSTENVIATSYYGFEFTSVVRQGNIYGVQFHPEKSHRNGAQLLKNFSEL